MSKLWVVVTLLGAPLALGACNRSNTASAVSGSQAKSSPPASQRINIAVTSDGFTPERSRIKVGQPVTLVVTRQVDRTCATEIVIQEYGINQSLPKDQPVEVTFTPTRAGPIRFACAMNMVAGELTAE